MGVGRMCAFAPPTYLYSGSSADSAAAFAQASDAPRMAFAPRAALVVRAVDLDHDAVDGPLVVGFQPHQRLGDLLVHVDDRVLRALAHVAVLVAVAQLDGFERSGRCARRHGRAAERPVLEHDLHFHGRIAARVQNLATEYIDDDAHVASYWITVDTPRRHARRSITLRSIIACRTHGRGSFDRFTTIVAKRSRASDPSAEDRRGRETPPAASLLPAPRATSEGAMFFAEPRVAGRSPIMAARWDRHPPRSIAGLRHRHTE